MRDAEPVLVDTSAWLALALTKDPLHRRAREAWEQLLSRGARLRTSIPIVIETFTFLERNVARDVALAWKDSLARLRHFRLLACNADDLDKAWAYFRRPDLHKLSAVDATSFALMRREGIAWVFAFDSHFATVGFRLIG